MLISRSLIEIGWLDDVAPISIGRVFHPSLKVRFARHHGRTLRDETTNVQCIRDRRPRSEGASASYLDALGRRRALIRGPRLAHHTVHRTPDQHVQVSRV